MTTKIFLPGLPQPTCEYLSRVLGKVEDGRPALSPSQIRTIPDSSGILIHGNKKPVLLDMVPFYKSRKLLARSKIPPPPLPENEMETELRYIPLDKEKHGPSGSKPELTKDATAHAHSNGEGENPHSPTPPSSPERPTTQQEKVEPVSPVHATPTSDVPPVTQHASNAPPWAGELLQESRRAREEVEILRESIGVHVVSRAEAAQILGVSKKTLYRYEKAGRIERVAVPAPGVHYTRDSIIRLKQEQS